jgi:Ser/Thr protein kinase RdoA (MazF antagonist)
MAFFREWGKEPRVHVAWDHLRNALENHSRATSEFGFVHNDAHVWNMLFDPDALPPGPDGQARAGEPDLCLIDFDVSGQHWFLCDCAAALFSFLQMTNFRVGYPNPLGPGFREWSFNHFWEGYRRKRPTPESWLKDLDLFLQYRRCLLFVAMQGETAKDTSWREAWIKEIETEDKKLFG